MKTSRLTAVFLTAFVAAALAQPGPDGERTPRKKSMDGEERHHGERHERKAMFHDGIASRLVKDPELVKRLGLTDEQVGALTDSAAGFMKQQAGFREKIERIGMKQARLITREGPVDEEALMEMVEKAGSIKTEMAKLHVKQLLLVKKTLTPEQLEEAHKIRAERMEKFHGGNHPESGRPREGRKERPDRTEKKKRERKPAQE